MPSCLHRSLLSENCKTPKMFHAREWGTREDGRIAGIQIRASELGGTRQRWPHIPVPVPAPRGCFVRRDNQEHSYCLYNPPLRHDACTNAVPRAYCCMQFRQPAKNHAVLISKYMIRLLTATISRTPCSPARLSTQIDKKASISTGELARSRISRPTNARPGVPLCACPMVV